MQYDLIVIGFGKSGKTLAAQAASADLKTAVIERDSERYGGTCINVACLPTKSLINKAKLRRSMATQGIAYDRAYDNAYFIRAIEAKNEMTAKLREKNYEKLADSPRQLSGRKEEANDYTLETRQVFPRTTFIDPPYSRVGLSEKEAREQYGDIVIKKTSASSVPKTQVVEETAGFLKVILDPESKVILGATLFCYQSEEVINLVTLAINEKIPPTVLQRQIYNHPVMSEAFNELLQ